MCGVFGWHLKPGIDRRKHAALAAILADANDSRGGDSWGFWADGKILRGLGDMAPHSWQLTSHLRVMAHTRSASTGVVTLQNAHPFEIGGIIGMHNGCISNWREMNARYNRNFEVDSQHIFAHIDQGLDTAELLGWGTVVWMQRRKPDNIYMCRMTPRAALAVLRCREGVVWSSDEKHLRRAADVARLNAQLLQIDDTVVYIAAQAELYSTDTRMKLGEYSVVAKDTFPSAWDWMGFRDNGDTQLVYNDPMELEEELYFAKQELEELLRRQLEDTGDEDMEDLQLEISECKDRIDELEISLWDTRKAITSGEAGKSKQGGRVIQGRGTQGGRVIRLSKKPRGNPDDAGPPILARELFL